MQEMTVPMVLDVLVRAGGAEESVDLTGDVADVELEDLGYESLAVLEAAGLVEREHDVTLDEAALADARTPRQLMDVINAALAPVTTA